MREAKDQGQGSRRGRRAARHALLLLSLFGSGWANAYTLDELLRLPLERLLQLEVSPRCELLDSQPCSSESRLKLPQGGHRAP